MGIISRTGDLFYAFRFLKLLVTPWDKMPAYELGIIDGNGKVLKKKRETPEEKSAYTVFHRLVFNIKRLLGKLPFGKTKLATYASALFLIKESTGMSEDSIHEILSEIFDDLENQIDLSEHNVNHKLTPGTYVLKNEIASIDTGEIIGHINNKVKANDFLEPYGSIFGLNIYQVEHINTKQKLLVTSMDIEK